MLKNRGLRILNTGFAYFSEGATAAIFVDRNQSMARKIFFCRECREGDRYARVFESEVKAYMLAEGNAELATYTPKFYGVHAGNVIVDKDSTDVTAEFFPDFAYDMEFIECNFEKMCSWDSEDKRVADLFRKNGINFMSDCSVCKQEGRIIKVIDFATEEFEPVWPDEPC